MGARRFQSGSGVALFALLACVAACAPEAGWGGSIEVRDGVTYVDNPAEGLWAGRDPFPVRFELEQVFGVDAGPPDDAMLGAVRALAVDDGGGVYLLDGQRDRLVAFAADGSLRWAAGQQGEGPRDFFRVRGMAWDGATTLLIANQSGTRLDRWETDGNYLSTDALVEVERATSFTGILPSGSLVFGGFLAGAVGTKLIITGATAPFAIVKEIEINAHPDLEISPRISGGIGARVVGDSITTGNDGDYVLRFYDATGELYRIVRRADTDLVRMGFHAHEDGGSALRLFGGLSPPLILASGHVIVQGNWPTNVDDPDEAVRVQMESGEPIELELAHSLDFFDAEGRYLGSIAGDGAHADIGSPWLVGPDGKLYTSLSDPFPQVRRYRVEITR